MNAILFWVLWILLTVFLPGFLVYWFARHGKPQNRWPFTEVPLGRAMVIKRGSLPVRVITGGGATYRDFHLVDTKGKPMDENSLDKKNGQIIDRDIFVNTNKVGKSGLYFIGWIPFVNRVHTFHFAWDELAKEEVKSGFEVKSLTMDTALISITKTFAFVAKELEMGGDKTPSNEEQSSQRIVITIVLSGRVLIVDVMKALIVANWYKQVNAKITQICTKWCGTHKIDELIADAGAKLIKEIMKSNAEILKKYGVVFYGLNYNGYEYTGGNRDEIEKAMNKRVIAQQEGEADLVKAEKKAKGTVITAGADAEAIKLKGIAQANALKLLREAAGDDPAMMQALAIQSTQ
ncbi:MAG: hypothetical protein NTU76_01960, partial [Candidatus Taylorbacteria bacterium]|nr:hypothetical protein [Candidatus Taylorbacteria bacterium]